MRPCLVRGLHPRAEVAAPRTGRTVQGAASVSRTMDYKDFYKILGVERNADDKAIKTAYRRMARKHHPDVSKGPAARFQEIRAAKAATIRTLASGCRRKSWRPGEILLIEGNRV